MGGFSALRANRRGRISGTAGCRAKPLEGCRKSGCQARTRYL